MKMLLDAEKAMLLFPFHLIFDTDFQILHFGKSLLKLLPNLAAGANFDNYFDITSPKSVQNDTKNIILNQRISYVVRAKEASIDLVGQIVYFSEEAYFLFTAQPVIREQGVLQKLGLSMNDFAAGDQTTDFLFLLQANKKSMEKLQMYSEHIQTQNKDLKELSETLQMTVANLQSSEEELRQNAEELNCINESLRLTSEELEHKKFQLERQNDVLEKKVYEKTKDLQEKNSLVQKALEELAEANEIVHKAYVELAETNQDLQQSQEEIVAQRDLLENKNKLLEAYTTKIIQNINSAQIIQEAILPAPSVLSEMFPDFFVLNKPKDIVSGDFYWVHQSAQTRILIAADCTGHGVSGAFMTMIGNTLLDRIVRLQENFSPCSVLDHLHEQINHLLNQRESKTNAGMDIGICVTEEINGAFFVHYAGAKRPLYYLENGESNLKKIEGIRRSVGGLVNEEKVFFNQTVKLSRGSLMYLATDGYADQNDKKRVRFSEKKFSETLESVAACPLKEQKEKLDLILKDFMTGTEQRDDILIVGVRI